MKFLLYIISVFIIFTGNSLAQDTQIQDQETFGGDQFDVLTAADITSDSGFIIAGNSLSGISGDKTENSNGLSDLWVVKFGASGELQWQNTIGGSESERIGHIIQTPDGGYILAASSTSDISGDKTENSLGGEDYWVLKLDGSGNIEWQNTIGGNSVDQLKSSDLTMDGGYIIGGESLSEVSGDKTDPSRGGRDYWILKLDFSGNIEWQRTFGGSSSDKFLDIINTTDGGYLLGGHSNSNISGDKTEDSLGGFDYWILKLDSAGVIQWQNTIGGDGADELVSIVQVSDGNFIAYGTSLSGVSGDKTDPSKGGEDYWVLKLDTDGDIIWQRTIGANSSDIAYQAIEAFNGDLLLAGSSFSDASGDKSEDSFGISDYWIVRLDSEGSIIFENTIGADDLDIVFEIEEFDDGSLFIGGHSRSDISGDKDEDNVGDIDLWFLKLNALLNVNDIDLLDSLKIVPNPVANSLRISSEAAAIEKVTLISVTGKVLQEMDFFSTSLSFDVSSLSSGVYYVQITSEGRTATKKFIKK